jgi:RHS repeat-associated protein
LLVVPALAQVLVFSSATPAPVAPKATFEGDASDNSDQFELDENFVVTSLAANHTTSGSKVVKMNQTYKIGPAKSLKVYPGDKIDMEVWEYHEGSSGFGTSTTGASALVNLIAAAFGGVSGGGGESQAIYDGVSDAITGFGAGGGNQGSNRPAAYINYLLFDKDYNPLDMGYTVVPDVTFTKQQLTIPTLNIEEEGYVFVYLSYDNDSPNWVYFDDFKVTHTKTNVIQSNEYYPFGLQTSSSWTRENNDNDHLYNAGNELNQNTGWYEMFFRGYDPALGRMMQVDPLASMYTSHTPYHYGLNSPARFNDPTGAVTKDEAWYLAEIRAAARRPPGGSRYRAGLNESWAEDWVGDFADSYADPGGYGTYVEYRYYWKTDGNGKEYDDRVEAEYKRHIEWEWVASEDPADPNPFNFFIDLMNTWLNQFNADKGDEQWLLTDHPEGRHLQKLNTIATSIGSTEVTPYFSVSFGKYGGMLSDNYTFTVTTNGMYVTVGMDMTVDTGGLPNIGGAIGISTGPRNEFAGPGWGATAGAFFLGVETGGPINYTPNIGLGRPSSFGLVASTSKFWGGVNGGYTFRIR